LLAALSGEVKARLCKTTADTDSVKRIAARVAAAPGFWCSGIVGITFDRTDSAPL